MAGALPLEDLINMIQGLELRPEEYTDVATLRTRLLNDLIALGLSSGMTNIGCRIFNSIAQSIPNSVVTALSFDSETYDTDNMHNLVNPTRITFTTAGTYLLIGQAIFSPNVNNIRYLQITVNGASNIVEINKAADIGGNSTEILLSTLFNFSAGDFAELQVFQDSGGALNVDRVVNTSPIFSVQKVG